MADPTNKMVDPVDDKDSRPVEDRLLEGIQAYLNVPTGSPAGGSQVLSPRQPEPSAALEAKNMRASAKAIEPPAKTDFSSGAPKHRGQWFLDTPPHECVLPAGGPINATMVEIIVLLPLWFRNRNIAERFLNNRLTTAIHFKIFEEHRNLGDPTLSDAQRARDFVSDRYRKAMRQTDPNWTKAKQATPAGWNATSIQINNFLPDVARQPHYHPPPSIPFRSLAVGLKKMPAEDDAADLTRALLFTVQNQRVSEDGRLVDYLFPDDFQTILDHIGRTVLTPKQYDPAVVTRYWETMHREPAAEERAYKQAMRQAQVEAQKLATPQPYPQQFQHTPPPTPLQSKFAEVMATLPDGSMGVLDFSLPSRNQAMNPENSMSFANSIPPQSENSAVLSNGQYGALGASIQSPPSINEGAAAAAAVDKMILDRADNLETIQEQHGFTGFPEIPEVCRLRDLEIVPGASQSSLQTECIVGASFTLDDLDALMASNQSIDLWNIVDPSGTSDYAGTRQFNADDSPNACASFSPRDYLPTDLLRNCAEANDGSNESPLARAARWARQPHNAHLDWPVSETDFIIDFLALNPVQDAGAQM